LRTEELANYIEKLRYGRNISQEIFLEEIISLRQYQRYRSGQSIMPIEILEKMAVRLSIPINKLLSQFEEDKNDEAKTVMLFYNSVVFRNLNKAKEILSDFKDYVFIDEEKELLFNSAVLLYAYFRDKIAKVELVKKQAELINYPDILKNDIVTDAELIILGTIFEYGLTERERIVDKLTAFLDNTNIIITENNVFPYIQVIFWISKHFGRTHNYINVVKYCDLGIELNNKNRTIYLLEYFYYYKALVYFRDKESDKFEYNLYKCILLLENDNSIEKKSNFYDIIMKDLKLNPY
jgi:transcriptional regulator with XRE-family HTH domain